MNVNFGEISILHWNDTFATGECTPSILMLIGHYFSAFCIFCVTVSQFNNYRATFHVHKISIHICIIHMHMHTSQTEDSTGIPVYCLWQMSCMEKLNSVELIINRDIAALAESEETKTRLMSVIVVSFSRSTLNLQSRALPVMVHVIPADLHCTLELSQEEIVSLRLD